MSKVNGTVVIKLLKEIGVFLLTFLIAMVICIAVGQTKNPIKPFSVLTAIRTFIWSDGFLSYLVIALLCWIVGVILLRVKSYSRCPYFTSSPDSTTFSLSLEGILKDIGGLYEDLQDTHSPLGQGSLRSKFRVLRESVPAGLPALVFVYNNFQIGDYARVARLLNNTASKSIKSTNISLPSSLFAASCREPVLKHLQDVNSKTNLNRRRIQIIKPDSIANGPDAIPNKSSFETDLKNADITQLWNDNFVASKYGVKYSKAMWNTDVTPGTFYGDFILYDEEIILMYDYESLMMTVVIGSKAGQAFGSLFNSG